MKTTDQQALAVLVGSRDVFPRPLAAEGRKEILAVLERMGVRAIVLSAEDPGGGIVESYQDAKRCAALFDSQRHQIDGVLVTLPNFGDERAVADTLKMAGLDVPVFVHAFADELEKMRIGQRRDSFCGKLSVCNNLKYYGISFSVGGLHVVPPQSGVFKQELEWFLGVCRVVKGLRRARIGCIGSRVPPFKTVRYSERILEHAGVSVETADLCDIVAGVQQLSDSDEAVRTKLAALEACAPAPQPIPPQKQSTLAKMALVIEKWVAENELDAYTIQCWPAMQDALGVFPCTVMSMMSNELVPAGCEADVMGTLSMYALQLAAEAPAALLDWNNNYGADRDKLVLFHCSNCPGKLLDRMEIGYNVIADAVIGRDKSYATCFGRLKSGPMTVTRVATDDLSGRIVSYVAEGELIDDPLDSFGALGVARIENLQSLLHYLTRNGFAHHTALSRSRCADMLHEAFTTYLGWDTHRH